MIKIDMSMPKNCIKCPFYNGYHGGTCVASDWDDLYFGSGFYPDLERHSNCPLKEVDEDD